MVLATEPGIWVPAVVLGHLIGICFLLYSLEKTNGSVSRLWKRMTIRSGSGGKKGGGVDGASVGAGSAAPVKLMRGMSADNEPMHYERAPRWVRGCTCKVNRVQWREREGSGEHLNCVRLIDCSWDDDEPQGPQGKKTSRRALGPSRPLFAFLCSPLRSWRQH